jgi:Uma2 family endonuclease
MAKVFGPYASNVLLYDVSWKTYECLLADLESRSAPRLAYDRGTLQIMSPLPEHELRNRTLALLVEVLAEEWNLDVQNLGSTTFRSEASRRGFEPDTCFYFGENAVRIRSIGREFDQRRDPAPDLVIEINITSPSPPRFPLYAQMSVPEVWRDDGDVVELFELTGGQEHAPLTESRALPGLTGDVLTRFVQDGLTLARPE